MAKNFTISGKAYWCKLLGDPEPGYDEETLEWSIDVAPSEKGMNTIRRLGLQSKLRDKDDDRGEFITFKRPLLKRNPKDAGKLENEPVPVVDKDGNPWPVGLNIGNGTEVKVKFGVFEIPARGKFKGGPKLVIYEVKVINLVTFEPKPAKVNAADAPADGENAAPAGNKPAANKPEKWDDKE